MRKNKSFKDTSLAKDRRSTGRQISIELEPNPNSNKYRQKISSRYEEGHSCQTTDRLDRSANWQHPSISQNILKDIINYSNISHSNAKTNKSSTLAAYDKTQDVMSQFAKISKKSSMAQVGRKDNRKLVLDHPMSENTMATGPSKQMKSFKEEEMMESSLMSKEIEKQPNKDHSSKKNSHSWSTNQGVRRQLLRQKEELTAKIDEMTIIEYGITQEYADVICEWEQMIIVQQKISQYQDQLTHVQNEAHHLKAEFHKCNEELLEASRQLVESRRSWEEKGSGSRNKVLDESIYCHEQFLRKITIRDFEETVLFNMKVAIPDHRGKTNLRGIYQELFHSKSTKKFTMILRKHSAHMDLYDGKLLNDFAKRINDLEGQYSRCQGETLPHPDEEYFQRIETAISNIDRTKSQKHSNETIKNKLEKELDSWKFEQKECQNRILKLIEAVNKEVRGDYQKQTEKAADFLVLLTSRYYSKYRQLRGIRENRERTIEDVAKLQADLQNLDENGQKE